MTFTFVTTRTLAELGILPSLGRDPCVTLVWLSWSMPLLATEVILQGLKGDGLGRGALAATRSCDVGSLPSEASMSVSPRTSTEKIE